MSGGWGCPHDDGGRCLRREQPCDPGAEGCVLEERLRDSEKALDEETGDMVPGPGEAGG